MKYCDVANILPWDFEFFFTSLLTGFAWASSWFLIESLLPLMTSAVATNSSWSAGSTSSSPTSNSWSTLHATNCTSLLIAVTVIVILRPATTIPSFLCTAGRKKCFVTCVNTPHWKINESPFILLTLYANLYKAKRTINCLSFMNEIYKQQQHYYKLHIIPLYSQVVITLTIDERKQSMQNTSSQSSIPILPCFIL